MGIVFEHRIRMPSIFPQLTRSLAVTEGVCVGLNPDFDFEQAAQTTSRLVYRDWFSPAHLIGEVADALRTLRRYSLRLPRQLSNVLAQGLAGGITLKINPVGLEKPLHRMDAMANRISFALVVAAIILSSAIIFTSERLAVEAGGTAQVLSIVYVVAGVVLGAWLLYSIMRSGTV